MAKEGAREGHWRRGRTQANAFAMWKRELCFRSDQMKEERERAAAGGAGGKVNV